MTSIRGHRCSCQEHPSIAPSVVPSTAFLDFSPTFKSGNKLSNQSARPLETKPPIANALTTATSVSTYSEDDLQRIFKAVLEAQAPAPSPVSALVISEISQKKLKTRFPDVNCGKSHINCYNFCQQCKDYFAIVGATGLTRILFALFFF